MTNFEARIRMKFGEIGIHFDNKEDLEKKLTDIQQYLSIIEKQKFVIPAVPERKVIPGLESIYTITAEGFPKIRKYPEKKSDIIKLALFLSEVPLSVEQITVVGGVKNPLAYVKEDDLVKLSDGRYILEAEERAYVSSKLIPELLKGESVSDARS